MRRRDEKGNCTYLKKRMGNKYQLGRILKRQGKKFKSKKKGKNSKNDDCANYSCTTGVTPKIQANTENLYLVD